jgi:hypothetical protein
VCDTSSEDIIDSELDIIGLFDAEEDEALDEELRFVSLRDEEPVVCVISLSILLFILNLSSFKHLIQSSIN